MREKSNLPLIFVAVVAAGLLLGGVCVCFGVVAYFMPPPAVQTLPTRDEMRAKLMGKTPQEVISLIGKPRTADDQNGKPHYWIVTIQVIDPVSGVVTPNLALWFDNDVRVCRVEF